MPYLTDMTVSDTSDVWESLGFASPCVVDGVTFAFGGDGKGITGWALDGAVGSELDGLPTAVGSVGKTDGPEHPNGVIGLDHVVVWSPDHARTVSAFEKAAMPVLRTRTTDSYGSAMVQAFFRLGPIIVELIGSPSDVAPGPARFFGLAWTCADLDLTAASLGSRLHPAKDAVQDGRRIATLDRSAGSRVAMAFMSR